MANGLSKAAAVMIASAAVAGCAPAPADQVRIQVAGIDGATGDEDLAVVVTRDTENAGETITFVQDAEGDLGVAEDVIDTVRGEVTVVSLSVLPDADGMFTIVAPLDADSLVFADQNAGHVAVSTEDMAHGDVDIDCELMRGQSEEVDNEDTDNNNNSDTIVTITDTFDLGVAPEVVDVDGELAALGFDLEDVAMHSLSGTTGNYIVLECDTTGSTRVVNRTEIEVPETAGDDDDSAGGEEEED